MTVDHATYRICPRCGRAVATCTQERFCSNDGERLLESCAECHAEISSPYAQFCAVCGRPYHALPGALTR
jgi:hypothetical protein